MKTILLVEDSKFLRLVNERTLARAGYRVLTAGDGEEAIAMATQNVPDLIFLDMLLPKIGGPQVLRSIRQNGATKDVPVVVLSSLPQSNETRLKKEGATAYFDKSTLNLHQHSESLIHIASTMLNHDAAGTAPQDPQEDSETSRKGKV